MRWLSSLKVLALLAFGAGLGIGWQLSRESPYGSHAESPAAAIDVETPRWTGAAQAIRYSYDGERRLQGTSEGGRLAYDRAGRVTRLERAGKHQVLVWNAFDQLVEVRFGDGTRTRYRYDPLGRLVARTDRHGTTTRYAYDGLNLIEERNDDGSVLASYVYAETLDHPVLMVTAKGPHLLIYDRMGSVVAVADLKGKVVARYRYDAWGNPLEETADIWQPFRFAGYLWDPDAKLYYLRARWYDPSLGRFLSPDPLGPPSLDPQDWNSYAYGRNDPANRIDPLGLWPPNPVAIDQSMRWQLAHQLNHRMAIAAMARRRRASPGRLWARLAEDARHLLAGLTTWRTPVIDDAAARELLALQHGRRWEAVRHCLRGAMVGGERTFCQSAVGTMGPVLLAMLHPALAAAATTQTLAVAGFDLADRNYYDASTGFARVALPKAVERAIASRRAFATLARSRPSTWPRAVGTGVGHLTDVTELGSKFQELVTQGRAQAELGGILLDKSARALGDLTDVRGAVWDRERRQLVLVGRRDRRLPPTRLDDLLTALEALYSGKEVGVSIDPGSTRGRMVVRYIPEEIRGTRLGEVLFEADRLLKVLSLGQDNVTGLPVRSGVPGYRSELDLATPSLTDLGRSVWHRMWFVPRTLSLREHAGAFVYDKAELDLRTQYFNPNTLSVSRSGSDPAARKFVAHLEANYGAYARERPVLAELLQAAKLVGLVKWLRDNSVQVDLDWLRGRRRATARTPATTPARTVSRTVDSAGWRITLGLYGGVDLSPEPTSRQDAAVGRLRTVVLAGRPSDATPSWKFRWRGRSWTAVAVSLARRPTPGGLGWSELDLDVTGGLYPWLGIVRHFDSRRPERGPFGRAWAALPFSLEFPKAYARTKLAPEVVLQDHVAASSWTFRLGGRGGGRRHYELASGPPITLTPTSVGYVVRGGDQRLEFDRTGRLRRASIADGTEAGYHWRGRRLSAIKLSGGRRLRLAYAPDGRIRAARDHTGRVVRYGYDGRGNLARVWDRLGTRARYGYDSGGRLVEATGPSGELAFRARYDALGRELARQPGGWRYRWGPDGRTVSLQSRGQALGSVRFDADMRASALVGRDGARWTVDEPRPGVTQLRAPDSSRALSVVRDRIGRVRSLTDSSDGTTRFDYDSSGRVRGISESYEGESLRATYDRRGALARLRDGDGVALDFGSRGHRASLLRLGGSRPTSIARDALGRPVSVRAPSGEATALRWDERDRLVSLQNPLLRFDVRYGGADGSRTATVVDGEGRALRYTAAFDGLLREVRDGEGGTIRPVYDRAGELVRLVGPDGRSLRSPHGGLSDAAAAPAPRYRATKSGLRVAGAEGELAFDFDLSGRILRSREADGRELLHRYTAAGRLEAMRYPGSGLRVYYGYDARGLLRSIGLGEMAPALMTFKRDADGRVTHLQAQDVAVRLRYTFGSVPRRILATDTDGGSPLFDTSYIYNGAGQIERETGTSGARAYRYDRAGRLTATWYGHAYVETSTYDPAGNRRVLDLAPWSAPPSED